jgi:hypothetical protein
MFKFKLDIENKDKVIKWLEKIKKGSGDARPLWIAMIPKVTEFVNYEFHDTIDGHKLWENLTSRYKKWKQKKGFSTGIGVMTGKLREGAGKDSIKQITPKSLKWILNDSNTKSNKGFNYAPVFNYGKRDGTQAARPIYKFTALRLNSFMKLDAKKFKAGSHASFTYKWFRNVLREAEQV